jgi:hypothetical protein
VRFLHGPIASQVRKSRIFRLATHNRSDAVELSLTRKVNRYMLPLPSRTMRAILLRQVSSTGATGFNGLPPHSWPNRAGGGASAVAVFVRDFVTLGCGAPECSERHFAGYPAEILGSGEFDSGR